ncbi:MAG: hypothetical protein ACFFCW_34205 [Candidatus Hodarchaeota archaeon]
MKPSVLRMYYSIRPFIPRPIQIIIRRKWIYLKRLISTNWPIDEKTALPPENWPGWPYQKKFALVLVHHVESEKGQEKCWDLINIENKLGFRSCFFFVPERYRVSYELLHYLTANGFEVGVHGLNHDGRLYESWDIFKDRSVRINNYLKTWNALGFSSPSNHHNLDWIHELNLEYDCSTFDTDPFEPQADGIDSIFPVLVNRNSIRNAYVELPYTLPQDFTLFVLLREKNIDIWRLKLNWIVEHGGMVFLSTHPDYMSFNEKRRSIDEYPIHYYTEFLEYIKSEYEGQYWHILPKEITAFWKQYCKKNLKNSKSRSKKGPI